MQKTTDPPCIKGSHKTAEKRIEMFDSSANMHGGLKAFNGRLFSV